MYRTKCYLYVIEKIFKGHCVGYLEDRYWCKEDAEEACNRLNSDPFLKEIYGVWYRVSDILVEE